MRLRSSTRRSTVPRVSVSRVGEWRSEGLPQCRRHFHRPPRRGGQYLFRERADRDHVSRAPRAAIRAFQTVRLRADLTSAISTGAVVPRVVHWPVEWGCDAAGVMSGSGSGRTASVVELGSGIPDPQRMGAREACVAPRRLRTAGPYRAKGNGAGEQTAAACPWLPYETSESWRASRARSPPSLTTDQRDAEQRGHLRVRTLIRRRRWS